MEPYIPMELRGAENQPLLVEAQQRQAAFRERMSPKLQVRRHLEALRKIRIRRRERMQERQRAFHAAQKLLEYAVRFAPRGSQREERRDRLKTITDRLAR